MEKHNPLDRILEQYEYHNALYANVLEDIHPKDTHTRINERTNHIAWLAGNLVSVRFRLAASLGITEEETFPHLFKDQKPLQVYSTYPDLVVILEDWNRITPILKKTLQGLTNEELLGPPSFEALFIGDNNLLGLISFIVDRESYAIGQLGLLRKAFGYPAMKYA